MSKCLFLLVLGFLTTTAHAQTQALTITLPGGAPLQLIWIDPGRFDMGGELACDEVTVPRRVPLNVRLVLEWNKIGGHTSLLRFSPLEQMHFSGSCFYLVDT